MTVFLHIWFLYTNSALPHFWKVCEKLLQFCSLDILNIFSTGRGNGYKQKNPRSTTGFLSSSTYNKNETVNLCRSITTKLLDQS